MLRHRLQCSYSTCTSSNEIQYALQTGENPLQVPEIIDSKIIPEIALVIQRGSHEFYSGVQSETMGFNGDYLGPTIRLYRDIDTTITFTNNIGEPSTVHGHGLHVNGEIDGRPQSQIQPGESWQITIPVRQEAEMSWYHPHLMGKTAAHVHAGLAGIYIIEDNNSIVLDLPKDYGINDIPLVVQDRSFTAGKTHTYTVDQQQSKDGLREDTLVVNGTLNAYHAVPKGWVRLRILNGSNSQDISLSMLKSLKRTDNISSKSLESIYDEKTVRVARTLNLIAEDGETNVLDLTPLIIATEMTRPRTDPKCANTYCKGFERLKSLRAEKRQ